MLLPFFGLVPVMIPIERGNSKPVPVYHSPGRKVYKCGLYVVIPGLLQSPSCEMPPFQQPAKYEIRSQVRQIETQLIRGEGYRNISNRISVLDAVPDAQSFGLHNSPYP